MHSQNFSMPSNMSHNFARVPQANIPRSQFRSPYRHITAFNSGYLVPFLVDEVLPGDTFNDKFSFFGRLSTQVVPIMDNLYLDTFHFYIPNRLIDENWEKLMGQQENPDDSIDYLVPQIAAPATTGFAVGSLFDFMGIVPGKTGFNIDAYWPMGYNLVWNTFFRDQNLQDSVYFDKGPGPHDATHFNLLRRGKRHDYFTSCLPWPQKGQAASLAFTGSAPVMVNTAVSGNQSVFPNTGSNPKSVAMVAPQSGGGNPLYADLSDASAFTINEFRQAFQLQMLLEMDARGGTRYVELLRSHFGVISPDFRLQRPEYLGGSTTRLTITQVPQTAATDDTSPQGNLAAYATVTNTRDGYVKSFVEHGIIICLMSVRADLTYQQGVRRMWNRRGRYDFFWPALANLGEMAVLNKEIFIKGSAGGAWDDTVWGYQEAWADYRYCPSIITGVMRSDAPLTLDVYHLSQDLDSPVLGDTFIQENPPVDRIVAIEDQPQIIMDVYGDLVRARPMPVFSTPGLITRL